MDGMSVWRLIGEDVRAWKRIGWGGADRAQARPTLRETLLMLWRLPGLRATTHYRLANAAHRHHIPLLPGILSRRALRLYGFDLPPSVPIGPGLYVPHPVGTVIMANRIGANCSLIASVTIGMRQRPIFPTLGDNVTIGAGARVLGAITVGDGAQIGGNAVVITDVPPGATAVGVPARIIPARIIPARVVSGPRQPEPVVAQDWLSASPSHGRPDERHLPPYAAERHDIESLDTAPLRKYS